MVAIKAGGVLKVQKLVSLVEQHKCERVFAHSRFPPGILPPELVAKKAMAYVAEDEATFTKVQHAVQGSSTAQCLWEVMVQDGKVWPVAVLLMTKKQ
eukprot:9230131-Alexandrium_andersonii.AAC.1